MTPLTLVALMACGLAVRLWVLRQDLQLDSDEALPGLMALHIAAGKEAPVFYYGQHYFGALEAYLVAGLFKLAGVRAWLIVVPPTAASLALIPLTYALAAHVGGRTAGLLASLPVAFPPPIMAKLFTNSGGGFSLAFALHAAALECTLRALESRHDSRWAARWALGSAFVMGFLCWVWQPALVLLPLLLLYLIARLRAMRRPVPLLAICAAVLPGLAPPLLYNATQGWPTLSQLGVKYTSPANEASSGEWGGPRAVATFIVTAFGGGNEAEGGANPLQAALVVVSFPALALLLTRTALRTASPSTLRPAPGGPSAYTCDGVEQMGGLRESGAPTVEPVETCSPCRPSETEAEAESSAGPISNASALWRRRAEAACVLAAAAALDILAAHNTVRHLVPAALLGFVFLGAALAALPAAVPRALQPPMTALAGAAALVAVVVPNLMLDARAGSIFRHFTATAAEVQTAVGALRARGLATGYSDYWSAYPMAYFSGEEIVIAPALPAVWGGRFDRYWPYTRKVDAVEDPAQLFVLLDAQCDLVPYVLPLEQHDATYRAEHVGRWYLVWDVHVPSDVPDEAAALLADWRRVIASGPPC